MAIFNSYVKLPEGNTLIVFKDWIPWFTLDWNAETITFSKRLTSAGLNDADWRCL